VAVSKTRESEDASEKRLERRELSTIRRRAVGKLVAGIVLVLVGVAFFAGGDSSPRATYRHLERRDFDIDRVCDDRIRSVLCHNAIIVLHKANRISRQVGPQAEAFLCGLTPGSPP